MAHIARSTQTEYEIRGYILRDGATLPEVVGSLAQWDSRGNFTTTLEAAREEKTRMNTWAQDDLERRIELSKLDPTTKLHRWEYRIFEVETITLTTTKPIS